MKYHKIVNHIRLTPPYQTQMLREEPQRLPSSQGKEFNCLLKGRIFQALHVKRQRKLSAQKPQETFRELYDRARTLEQHEKQYAASAASKSDTQRSGKKNEQASQLPRDPATKNTDCQDSETDSPQTTPFNSQTD